MIKNKKLEFVILVLVAILIAVGLIFLAFKHDINNANNIAEEICQSKNLTLQDTNRYSSNVYCGPIYEQIQCSNNIIYKYECVKVCEYDKWKVCKVIDYDLKYYE